MEKSMSKFVQNGGTYRKVGDYYIPNITVPPETDERPIGIWGSRHKQYLREHKKAIFTIMQMSCTLHTYLADLNEQAEDMFNQLIKDMAKAEGVTEQLKATDQMAWVGKMENIRNRAMEIVNTELIYT